MYSPADGMAKESPKGGMLLRGYYIPVGTTIMVSSNYSCLLHV